MNPTDENLNVKADLARNTKELKDLLAQLDIAKREKTSLDVAIESNKVVIAEQKAVLTDTMNAIAAQKVEWGQDKAQQEREIASKKSEVDAVLARSSQLDEKEASTNKEMEDIKKVRAEVDAIRFETEQTKTAVEVAGKAIEEAKKAIADKEADLDRKIERFKEGVSQTIASLSNI